MPDVAFRTIRGTSLTARVSASHILILHRGREIANLPRDALFERNSGIHLSKDCDPSFWLDSGSVDFLLSL